MVILPNRRKYMVGVIPSGASVPMSECVVTLASDSAAYTGSARTIGVTVTWEGATLAVNTDYTLAWANNVNVGPATVTVTGMGQFTGSVTKTFYVVSASEQPWNFDLANIEYVGSKSLPSTNALRVMPIVEGVDGHTVVPVAYALTNKWLAGYVFPKDDNGEYHVENIVTDDSAFVDGNGAGDSFLSCAYFDNVRSFWANSNSGMYLKEKSGTLSPDLSGVLAYGLSPSNYPLFLANSGRKLIITQGSGSVYLFDIATPYDVSTIDLSSKNVMSLSSIASKYGIGWLRGVIFEPGGAEALLSISTMNTICRVSCSTPYDLSSATFVAEKSLGSISPYNLCMANGGRTLFVCATSEIHEYGISA